MKHVFHHMAAAATLGALLMLGVTATAWGQQETRWLSAGSLHNWISNFGCEIEVGRSSGADQQDGLQWPAWYSYQDCQAAKGLWIGVKDWTDATGSLWDHKIVHVGPRVRGTGEFIPMSFEMVSKYTPPYVEADFSMTEGKTVENDRVDPTQKADRMVLTTVNTAIGVTMERKVMQFSNQFHDNYHIYEFTFTNTGNINADPTIELPGQTLTGLYFYWQYRRSPVADVRYVIGNATSWGKNAMNDARGDGFILPTTGQPDADDAVDIPGVYTAPHMRAQFTWHGKFPPFSGYDNIGAPIWVPYYDKTDTTGRLGAPHFVGNVTLHADKSATDKTDDPAQPTTTSFVGSDEANTSGNDQYNRSRMDNEYTQWIAAGHKAPPTQSSPGGYLYPRHAWVVEPQGKFNEPTGDPALNTPGGFSSADGFGPYTLGPGQSIKIVIAEAAAGLSRDACITYGRQFKAGQITTLQKNNYVFQGKDSLFQTFRRAIANYKSNYGAPPSPVPPSIFSVASGDPITMTWEVENPSDPNLKGFRIFRSVGRFDGDYVPVYTAGPAERSYKDALAERGLAYYYYIVTIGDPTLNTGAALTPKDTLFSNRIYTQTYNPVYFKAKRPPGLSMDSIRIVPNPFVLSARTYNFTDEPDKIAFFNIPGRCKIKIYTELGEKVTEIEHTNGSGDEYWNSITSSRQVVVSGIYIVVFEDMDTGNRAIQKLSIIR
jgi:hypothetical protein